LEVIFGVRRLDAAFVWGVDALERSKAPSSRRTPNRLTLYSRGSYSFGVLIRSIR
jgi:hypothetical protein